MSFTWLLVLLAGICLVSLAVSAGLLWLACKLFRVPNITYRRSLLAALALALVNLALLGIQIAIYSVHAPALGARLDLLRLAMPFVVVGLFLRGSGAKIVGVALVWLVLVVVVSIGSVVGIKRALVEALINPTGGMAETLWGYHKTVTCPQCQFVFPVHAAEEVEARPPRPIAGCTCPNCRYVIDFARERNAPPLQGGDRFFATKGLLRGAPERFDVVLFQYPKEVPGGPINYTKRLVGLPGETLGIYGGKLYARPGYEGEGAEGAARSPRTKPPTYSAGRSLALPSCANLRTRFWPCGAWCMTTITRPRTSRG